MRKSSTTQKIYINEIIRINYKCNWTCKFCNVLKTNNYWEKDVSNQEVVYKILSLLKKYSKVQLNDLILSFSWWEPTLNKNLILYIKLAKKIWVWTVEIQTNWTILFKDKDYINELIKAWLDDFLLAQHSSDEKINKELWCFHNINDFTEWIEFVKTNNINKKILIHLNIIISKINIFSVYNHLEFLLKIWFFDLIENSDRGNWIKELSFAFVQPNWYAEINKQDLLLEFNKNEISEIKKIIKLCINKNIYPDFHYTSPPICILYYPKYNLEYNRLKQVENDWKEWTINKSNLESYKYLWKEKRKLEECGKCNHTKYCLWFYNNWINFVWEDKLKRRIEIFINKN